jgi:hypothetical protein
MRTLIYSFLVASAFSFTGSAEANWGPQTIEDDMLSVVNGRFTRQADLVDAICLGYLQGCWKGVVPTNLATAERAADGILDHRAGADGFYGTSDDNPFDSLVELYNVKGVGPETMEGIEIFVSQWSIGAPLGSGILNLVNSANMVTLDIDANISKRAATNLVDYRENGLDRVANTSDDEYRAYTKIFGTGYMPVGAGLPAYSVDSVPYVGPASIDRLYDYSLLSGIAFE